MPGKEKRFKAVTEEVVPTPPEATTQPTVPVLPIQILKEEEKHKQEVAKIVGTPGVPETNNIVPVGRQTSRKNVLLFITIMLLVAFIIMALAGGVYVYLNGIKNLPSTNVSEIETPSPTFVPQATPAPVASTSATPKPDYSLFNVSVLNGSGAIGAATAVRDLIQKGGFKVSYLGNADNFNFTDTIIQMKNTVSPDVATALKNLLVPTYSVKIGTPLDSQSRWDIIITVGSK